MGLNISSLEQVPVLFPELVLTKVYEDTILNRIAISTIEGQDPGIFKIRILDVKANLSPCCTPYVGQDNVIERMAEVICFKDGQTYCETEFAQVLRDHSVVYTAGNESAGSFELTLSEAHLAAFLEAVDVLVFQGDKASSDTNLNLYDGLIKQAETEGGVVVTTTATNLYGAFVEAYLALNEDAIKMGGDIFAFVPVRWGELFKLALTQFRLLVANEKEDLNVPGLETLKVIPTRGMNGAGKILLTPQKNIRYITNRKPDLHSYEWKYIVDKDGDYYIWRVKTIFGITLVIPEWAVIMTVPAGVVNGQIVFNVNIVNEALTVHNDGSFATT